MNGSAIEPVPFFRLTMHVYYSSDSNQGSLSYPAYRIYIGRLHPGTEASTRNGGVLWIIGYFLWFLVQDAIGCHFLQDKVVILTCSDQQTSSHLSNTGEGLQMFTGT